VVRAVGEAAPLREAAQPDAVAEPPVVVVWSAATPVRFSSAPLSRESESCVKCGWDARARVVCF
jgi:hypothetical protein